MPAMITIAFCKKNLELYSQSVYDLLTSVYADTPDVEIVVQDCLDRCGMCTDVPFAMRDNALVGGRDPRDLYRKLERGMEVLRHRSLPGTARYRTDAEPAVTGDVPALSESKAVK